MAADGIVPSKEGSEIVISRGGDAGGERMSDAKIKSLNRFGRIKVFPSGEFTKEKVYQLCVLNGKQGKIILSCMITCVILRKVF